MKFLADMPISPKTVDFLKSHGHEAIRLADLGMAGAEDMETVDYARQHDMVILTMDLDFGGLMAQRAWDKPSVVTFRLENPETARINRILQSRLSEIEADLQVGALVTVAEFRVRVRALPI
ncbi:MAG: DUF5615 family PIN-like protein [Candidatus Neomarinimicrobiota bacterium]